MLSGKFGKDQFLLQLFAVAYGEMPPLYFLNAELNFMVIPEWR